MPEIVPRGRRRPIQGRFIALEEEHCPGHASTYEVKKVTGRPKRVVIGGKVPRALSPGGDERDAISQVRRQPQAPSLEYAWLSPH